MFDVEEEEHIECFFLTLERMWGHAHPDRMPLRECCTSSKDYEAFIEHARLKRFPRSRFVNDYFHLKQKEHTVIEKKLRMIVLRNGNYVQEKLQWVMSGSSILHDILTFDLYSALHGGVLPRLRDMNESLVAEYLGPEGNAIYTQRGTLAELKERYNVVAVGPDGNVAMLYSHHWQGVSGIIRGIACGDEPQEAMHSDLEKTA